MNKKGLTLIELAIVLVIIGVLLAAGIGLFKLLVVQEKFRKDKYVVQTACESIKGYALQHKSFPSSLSALGVDTINPYKSPLQYEAISLAGDFCENNPSDWIKIDDKGTIRDNVAFIVYSTGKNMKDDSKCSLSPSPCTTPSVDYQIRNYGDTTGTGTQYDDIVCFMDIYSLREDACPKFEITTNSLPEAIQFINYDSRRISVSGGSISSCNITLSVTGLVADNTNCKITGTPEVYGTFPVTITITDTIGRTATKTLNLVINPNPVRITTPSLPYGYENQSYKVALTASGGTGNYSWTSNTWDLDSDGDADLVLSSTGILEAHEDIPSDPSSKILDVPAGTYSITIQVCDSTYTSACDTKTFPLTILSSVSGGSGGGGSGGGGSGGGGGGGGCGGSSTISLQNYLPSSVFLCDSYNGSLVANGGVAPYSWSLISGNLPKSVSFCNSSTSNICNLNGFIIDKPQNYNFSVYVQDSCSNDVTGTFSISVNPTDMTGISGSNCSTSGIKLKNKTGSIIYYSTASGSVTCQPINNNKSIRVYPGDIYYFYSTNSCGTASCKFNFCDLWSVEIIDGTSGCDVALKNLSTCQLKEI